MNFFSQSKTVLVSGFLVALVMLSVVGCRVAKTVDHGGTSFVDTDQRSYVDTGSGSTIDNPTPRSDTEVPIVNATETTFQPPPGNYTENATIDIETKKGFIGKDVVKLWVWNEKGSQAVIAAEGNTITIPKMNVVLKIGPIGHANEGEVLVYVNTKPSKVLRARQETKVDSTWIYISDLFLNAAQ